MSMTMFPLSQKLHLEPLVRGMEGLLLWLRNIKGGLIFSSLFQDIFIYAKYRIDLISIGRYMAAGVFSNCVLANGCCVDPVTYERIDDEMKNWIWKKAPGVRESRGCPKKKSRMYIIFILLLLRLP